MTDAQLVGDFAHKMGFNEGVESERKRIIELLLNLGVVRRDAFGVLVAMDTYAETCVDLIGLEK